MNGFEKRKNEEIKISKKDETKLEENDKINLNENKIITGIDEKNKLKSVLSVKSEIIKTEKWSRNNNTNNQIKNITSQNNHAKKITPLVKIAFDTDVKKAIDYVLNLLENEESVLICGLSLAISKVILIAEIVKTKISEVHQVNNIDCLITHDKFDKTKIKRVPKLDILLSLYEPNEKGTGYQSPSTIKTGKYKLVNINEDISKIIRPRRVIILGHMRRGPRWRIRK